MAFQVTFSSTLVIISIAVPFRKNSENGQKVEILAYFDDILSTYNVRMSYVGRARLCPRCKVTPGPE